ncbi:MAG: CbtB-domain containing protein [Nitrosopumilus sp.]|nr:MAG: CbtB-domain containing protein [Nitrosopumilus sp.]
MSKSEQITRTVGKPPILAVALLAVVFAFGLFIVGFDQGHIFSVIQGVDAYEELYIHELTHDMRHAAGFPCH